MKIRLNQKIAYLLAAFSVMAYFSAPEETVIPVQNIPAYEQKQTIYLLDEDELLVPVTIFFEEQEDIEASMKKMVQIMAQSQPFEGFQSILPVQSKLIDVKLENAHADLIFNTETLDYQPQLERKITEALTWTMTQFDGVSSISIWIEDQQMNTLPYYQTPADYLTQAIGINSFSLSATKLHDTIPIHLVYDKHKDDQAYKIIMTQRVDEQNDLSSIEQVIFDEMMVQLPASKRFHKIQNGKIDQGVFHLYFDESILFDENSLDRSKLENLLLSYANTFHLYQFVIHAGDEIITYNQKEIIDVSDWIMNEKMF